MGKANFIFLLLFVLITTSCNISQDEKIKKRIKDYMFNNLNDFDSYKPIEYGNIDSLYSDYTLDAAYIHFTEEYKKCKKTQDSLQAIIDEKKLYSEYPTMEEVGLLVETFLFLNTIYPEAVDSIKYHHNSHFIGMGIIHKFRTKTISGSYKLCEWQFIFTPDISKVISTIDLEREKPLSNYSKVENGQDIVNKEAELMRIKYGKEKKEHDAFFDSLARQDGIQKAGKNIYYKMMRKGNGEKISLEDKVSGILSDLDDKGNIVKTTKINNMTFKYIILSKTPLCKGDKIRYYVSFDDINLKKNVSESCPYSITRGEFEVFEK